MYIPRHRIQVALHFPTDHSPKLHPTHMFISNLPSPNLKLCGSQEYEIRNHIIHFDIKYTDQRIRFLLIPPSIIIQDTIVRVQVYHFSPCNSLRISSLCIRSSSFDLVDAEAVDVEGTCPFNLAASSSLTANQTITIKHKSASPL